MMKPEKRFYSTVDKGETCLMSMIASFKDKISKVSATTESESELVFISNEKYVRQLNFRSGILNN